jgi:hypothetical protein
VTLISVHAPTEEKSEEEKKQSFEILGRTSEKTASYDIITILELCNAKIGK